VGHELYLVRQGHAPLATWPYSMSVKRCCIGYIGQVTRFYEKVAHYEGQVTSIHELPASCLFGSLSRPLCAFPEVIQPRSGASRRPGRRGFPTSDGTENARSSRLFGE
jgi:hypothetical protein